MRTPLGARLVAGLALGLVLAALAPAWAADAAAPAKKHRIVYHLDDVDKVRFALGNIQNHVAGVGGWQNIDALELVVNGPALRAFVVKDMDPAVRQALERLQAGGLTFTACGITMKAFGITLDQLPKGTHEATKGGVVRLMELEEEGYAYIKP